MSREDLDRPFSDAASSPDVVHRRWVLSTRADDGRPLLVREDRVIHPVGLPTRAGPASVMEATETLSVTPALT